MVTNPLQGKSISLPILGTVSLTAAIIGGLALFLLFRKKRVSSRTVTTRFRK